MIIEKELKSHIQQENIDGKIIFTIITNGKPIIGWSDNWYEPHVYYENLEKLDREVCNRG